MEHRIAVALGVYLLVLNLAAFFTYGWDKWKARRNQWRVPEHTLLALTFAGGGVGALLGMRVFHHKTRKAKFRLGVPGRVAAVGAAVGGSGGSDGDVAVLMAIF